MNKSEFEWVEWLKALVIAVVFAFLIRHFVVSPIIVDGPSMQPTLYDADQMIVNKFLYRVTEPKRFDIVIFHATREQDFIKRVVGLPGEHVAIKNDVLYINGEKVEEAFLENSSLSGPGSSLPKIIRNFKLEDLPGDYEVIPPGHVFVLGDNRYNSRDSRDRLIGLVSMDEIIGKATFIYWPPSRIGAVR